MTKIMFHCDWGQNSEQLLDHYRWLTPEGSGKWGDLEGTTNKEEADFHIVMDGYPSTMDGGMPDDIDPQTVIYFQREEPQVKPPELVWDNIFYQATFTDMRHHNVAVWRVKKTYDELQNRMSRVRLFLPSQAARRGCPDIRCDFTIYTVFVNILIFTFTDPMVFRMCRLI